jgi:hypothetical protein
MLQQLSIESLAESLTVAIEEVMTHFVWMWQRLYERSRASIAEGGAFLKQHLRG